MQFSDQHSKGLKTKKYPTYVGFYVELPDFNNYFFILVFSCCSKKSCKHFSDRLQGPAVQNLLILTNL